MLRRIPLGKMNNLRDLGGYPAGDGVTVWERFLRGDNPAGLSEQDIQWLRERDITTIVDLRSGEELARQPDQLRPARFSIPPLSAGWNREAAQSGGRHRKGLF